MNERPGNAPTRKDHAAFIISDPVATTTLFVEILVMGALAELGLAGILLAFLDMDQVRRTIADVALLKDFASLVVVLALALTYGVGWTLNFAARQLFNPRVERQIRKQWFEGTPEKYDKARSVVFQYGSAELVHDLLLDRHIVRIARSNVLNFTFLALAALLNAYRIDLAAVILFVLGSAAVVVLSLKQWRIRYEAYYAKVAMWAEMLRIGAELKW